MSTEVATIIAALGGVIVGALTGEFRYLLQARRERKAVLREVLFNLLEIWYELSRRNVKVIVSFMKLYFVEQFGPEFGNEVEKTFADERFASAFRKLLLSIPQRPPESRYDRVLESLAPIDPVLAYRLSGKTDLLRYEEHMRPFITATMQAAEQDSGVTQRELADSVSQYLENRLHEDAVKSIEEDIRKVCSAISITMRLRCARLLANVDKRIEVSMRSELDDYMRHMMKQVKSNN